MEPDGSGGGAAAVVSVGARAPARTRSATRPTAVTGFAIGYIIDRPGNAGEYGRPAAQRPAAGQAAHAVLPGLRPRAAVTPGMADNPWGDHGRPGVPSSSTRACRTSAQEAGAALLSLSNSSDIIEQLTDYIAHGRGRDGVHQRQAGPVGHEGQPVVQEDRPCPTAEWPLLDDLRPETGERVPAGQPADLPQPARGAGHHAAQDLRRPARTAGRTCRRGATPTPARARTPTSSAGSTGSPTARASCSASSASATRLATGCAPPRSRPSAGTYVAPTTASLSAALRLSRAEERSYGPVRARPGRRPQVPHGLPGHDGRLHRRPAAEPGPGRRRQGRAVHPDLDVRGPAAGQRQRRAARRLPADHEDRASRRRPVRLRPGGRRRGRGAEEAGRRSRPTSRAAPGGGDAGSGGTVTPPSAAADRRRPVRGAEPVGGALGRAGGRPRCRPPRRSGPTSPAACSRC